MKLISPLILLLIIAATMALAKMPVDLPNFAHWMGKELKADEKTLHEKVAGPNKNSSIKLADYGSSNASISRREGNGIPEIHDHMDDYFVVQSGEATLIIGGEVVNPKKQEDARETRGDSIKGGEKKKLVTGDVVHIPHRMPHQLLVDKAFTYFVIKVKAE